MSLSLWVKWKPLQEAKRRALALETVDQVQMGNGVLSVVFSKKRFTLLEF